MNERLKMAIKQAGRYKHLGTAKSAAASYIKSSAIIMGDDGYYWVLPAGAAFSLAKLGYEGMYIGIGEHGLCWKDM